MTEAEEQMARRATEEAKTAEPKVRISWWLIAKLSRIIDAEPDVDADMIAKVTEAAMTPEEIQSCAWLDVIVLEPLQKGRLP